MEIIATPRRGGKTTTCVEWAKLTGGTIVTISEMESARLVEEYELNPKQVVSFDNLRAGRHRGMRGPYMFDNLDIMLSSLCLEPVTGITITEDRV